MLKAQAELLALLHRIGGLLAARSLPAFIIESKHLCMFIHK